MPKTISKQTETSSKTPTKTPLTKVVSKVSTKTISKIKEDGKASVAEKDTTTKVLKADELMG
jgi:hypothetical protein